MYAHDMYAYIFLSPTSGLSGDNLKMFYDIVVRKTCFYWTDFVNFLGSPPGANPKNSENSPFTTLIGVGILFE